METYRLESHVVLITRAVLAMTVLATSFLVFSFAHNDTKHDFNWMDFIRISTFAFGFLSVIYIAPVFCIERFISSKMKNTKKSAIALNRSGTFNWHMIIFIAFSSLFIFSLYTLGIFMISINLESVFSVIGLD